MKTYESVKPTDVLNEEGNPIGQIGVGEELTGEPIEIDGTVYLETEKGFVEMDAMAEVAGEAPTTKPAEEATKGLTSSSKKLIMALIGFGVGFGFAKYRKMSTKGIVIASIAGIGAGLAIDYFINKSKEK